MPISIKSVGSQRTISRLLANLSSIMIKTQTVGANTKLTEQSLSIMVTVVSDSGVIIREKKCTIVMMQLNLLQKS